MAPEKGVQHDGTASRAVTLRRRCLLAALASTAVLAATTFDFRPLLPDEGSYEWTLLILGVYVYLLWPGSLLGLVASVALYVATLLRPDSFVARLMPDRPNTDAALTHRPLPPGGS